MMGIRGSKSFGLRQTKKLNKSDGLYSPPEYGSLLSVIIHFQFHSSNRLQAGILTVQLAENDPFEQVEYIGHVLLRPSPNQAVCPQQ